VATKDTLNIAYEPSWYVMLVRVIAGAIAVHSIVEFICENKFMWVVVWICRAMSVLSIWIRPVGTQDIHPDDVLTGTSGFSAFPEEDSIYAFHYYSAPCPANLSLYLDEREADARRLKAVLFASEFWMCVDVNHPQCLVLYRLVSSRPLTLSPCFCVIQNSCFDVCCRLSSYRYAGDQQGYEQMVTQFNEFETRRISFTGWLFKNYAGSVPGGTCTGCGSSFFTNDGHTLDFLIKALARPFASAVNGKVTPLPPVFRHLVLGDFPPLLIVCECGCGCACVGVGMGMGVGVGVSVCIWVTLGPLVCCVVLYARIAGHAHRHQRYDALLHT
jgi:hypothetical protein